MNKASTANNCDTRQDLTATAAKASFKDWRAAVAHITESGRKLGKSKFFEDIKRGLLRRQADGTFRLRDLERYMASLPMSQASEAQTERAQDRQRRKKEAEIRKIEAAARREEFDLSVKMGRYIPREQVHLELAARAVALSLGLKTALEAKSLDIISAIDGNPKKACPCRNCWKASWMKPLTHTVAKWNLSWNLLKMPKMVKLNECYLTAKSKQWALPIVKRQAVWLRLRS